MGPIGLVILTALVAAVAAFALGHFVASRRFRAQLASSLFARDIIDNAGEGIVVYDRELRYVLWNTFMQELTGLRAEAVIGRRAVDVFPHLAEFHVEDMLRRALRGETISAPDVHYGVAETGRGGWVSSVYRPYVDHRGSVIGVVALIRDITQSKLAEQEMEYHVYHDALTGLGKRNLFSENLAHALALAHRRARVMGVVIVDLDHLGLMNDSAGRAAGDEFLQGVARRLKALLRKVDTVARLGDDEFGIVLHELARPEDAALVARKILDAVAEPLLVGGKHLSLSASVGIAVFPSDGEDASMLVENAEAAMHRAKEMGRNTYQMATAELSRYTHERMTVENGLRRALRNGEFVLLYQPQVDIDTGNVIGMEALLRWRDPELGMILPQQFIAVAEERGLILPIGEWVLRQACADVRRLHDRGLSRFRVAVNISAIQFREASLRTLVQSALADSGIEAETLELEITESVAMENVQLTMLTLEEFRQAGVTIAIDDFGTGHSSLSYLKQFPIDALKIDRTFVTDLPDKFEDAAIVSSVVQLANGLGLRVVAEGVEKREQLDFLRDAGCREVQGYYFSHPVPIEELEEVVFSGVPLGPLPPYVRAAVQPN